METVSKIIYKKGEKISIVASNIKGINPFPQSFKDLTNKALVLPTIINSATQSIILDKNETTVFRIEINQNRGVCIGAKSAAGNFKITKIYMK